MKNLSRVLGTVLIAIMSLVTLSVNGQEIVDSLIFEDVYQTDTVVTYDSLEYNNLTTQTVGTIDNVFMDVDVSLHASNPIDCKIIGEKTSTAITIYVHLNNTDIDYENITVNDYVYNDNGNPGRSESDNPDYSDMLTFYVSETELNDTVNIHIDFVGDLWTVLDINLSFDISTGINNFNTYTSSSNEVTLYPNPVVETLNVSGDFENVSIYDLSGKMLVTTSDSRVDMRDFKNGVYIVNVDGVSKKIIKK